MSELEIVASFLGSTQVAAIGEDPIQFSISPVAVLSSNNSQCKVVNFSWGDATPLLIAEICGVVSRCEITIIEPFNVPSTVSVGTDLGYSDIFFVPELTFQDTGTYEIHPLREFESTQQVFLSIAPGIECNSGSGIITIDWSKS